MKPEFIVQTIDAQITSDGVHEIKDNLDSDYSHLVGIALSDVFCSTKSVLKIVKLRGLEILPEDFEAVHIITSRNVAPNERFYTLFEPLETRGDEITVKFYDADFSTNYNLQIHLLLSNEPEKVNRVAIS